MDVLSSAVTPATQRCYSQVEGQWLMFVSRRFPLIDPWFGGIIQREKRVVLVNFMKFISDEHHNVSTVMGGLRHLFRTRLADLSIFDDGVIRGECLMSMEGYP